jgi:hypothetical protein
MNTSDKRGFGACSGARASLTVSVCVLLLLPVLVPHAHAQEERFFLKVSAGSSFPLLENLNNELALQGNSKVDPGYSMGVSLGRTFAEMAWSLEGHFAFMLYPDFNYKNASESFVGKLKHYNYAAILRWYPLPEGKAFKPTIGAGIGYGLTDLISGGGKLGAAEVIATVRVDSAIRENMDLAFESSYHGGLQSKRFEKPFQENVATDIVQDSSGNALRDRFNSIEVRVGITVWLRQRMEP